METLAETAGRVDGASDGPRLETIERLAARLEALVHEVEIVMRRVHSLERGRIR